MKSIIASIRIVIATLLICVGIYTSVILAFANLVSPDTADGSLIRNGRGQTIGSRLIAQQFTQPGYFWSRPSAVGYNAAGAGGSNKSPTSPDLTERASKLVTRYSATRENPLPAELAATSGSGLDPHITAYAARYQAKRVAGARGLDPAKVEALITDHTFAPGGILMADQLVNVLELNLALDALH